MFVRAAHVRAWVLLRRSSRVAHKQIRLVNATVGWLSVDGLVRGIAR